MNIYLHIILHNWDHSTNNHVTYFLIKLFFYCSFCFTAKLRRYREFPYIPCPITPTNTEPTPLSNSPTPVVHMLQLMNLHWQIITQSSYFTLGFTLGVVHSVGLDKRIITYIHPYNIVQNSVTALKLLCALPIHPSSLPPSLAITDLFTVSLVLPFPECHIVGIIQYVAFSNGLFFT